MRTVFAVEIERRRFGGAADSPFVRLSVLPTNQVTVLWGSGFGTPRDPRRSVSRCSRWRNGDRVDDLDLMSAILNDHLTDWCSGVATHFEQTTSGGSLELAVADVESDPQLRFLKTPRSRPVHAVNCDGISATGRQRCDNCAANRVRLQKRSSKRRERDIAADVCTQRTKRDRAVLESDAVVDDVAQSAELAFDDFVSAAEACVVAVGEASLKLQEVGDTFQTLTEEQLREMLTRGIDLSRLRDALVHVDNVVRYVLLGQRTKRDAVDVRFVDVLHRVGHRAYRFLCRSLPFMAFPSRTLLMSVRPRMERHLHTKELATLLEAKRVAVASVCDLDAASSVFRQLTSCAVTCYDELVLRPQIDGSRIAGGSLYGPRVGVSTPSPHVALTPTKDASTEIFVTSAMCFSVHVFSLNLTVMYGVYPTIDGADGGQVAFALQEVDQSLRALGVRVIGHVSDAGRVQIRAENKLRAALSDKNAAPIDDDSESSSESESESEVADDDDDGVARQIDFAADAPINGNVGAPVAAAQGDADVDLDAADEANDDSGVDYESRDTPLSYSWRNESYFDCLLDEATAPIARAALERPAPPHSFDFVHLIKLLFKHLHRSDGCKLIMAADCPVISFAPLKRLVHIVRAAAIQLNRPDITTRRLARAATPPKTSYDTMKAKPALAVFGTQQFEADVMAVWSAAQNVPYVKSALERDGVTLDSLAPLVDLSRKVSWLAEHVFMSKLAVAPRRYWTVLRPRMVAEAATIASQMESWPSKVPDQFSAHKPPKQTLQLFVKMLHGHVEILDTYYAHAAQVRSAAVVLDRPEKRFVSTARAAAAATQGMEDGFRNVRETSREPDSQDVDASFSASNNQTLRDIETGRNAEMRNAQRQQHDQSAALLSAVADIHK